MPAYTHMVVRQAFGGKYWETTSFGPMTKEDAEEMVNSEYGGHMMTVAQFIKGGHR